MAAKPSMNASNRPLTRRAVLGVASERRSAGPVAETCTRIFVFEQTPETERRSLSVVIPLFQEEAAVPALARELAAFLERERCVRPVELVLVDDGSTDRTHQLLRAHFGGEAAEIRRHDRNLGLTQALRTGAEAANGDLIGWLDSDLTYEPHVLSKLALQIDAGADVACASCYHPDGGVDGVPPWRLWLSTLASRSYRRLTRAPLHTFTCMVRVYRKEVLAQCVPERGGFLGVTEVLLRALSRGYRVVETPAVLRRRQSGHSKMRVLRVGWQHLNLMRAVRARAL